MVRTREIWGKVQKEMNLRFTLSTVPRLFLGKESKDYMKGVCHTYGAKVRSSNIGICLESGQEEGGKRVHLVTPPSLTLITQSLLLTWCPLHIVGDTPYVTLNWTSFWPHHTACGILAPGYELNLRPQQWKHRDLTTEPPGNSLLISSITIYRQSPHRT